MSTDETLPDERETLVAALADDFHERLVRSESPASGDYESPAGSLYPDLHRAFEAERALDRALEPHRRAVLPRSFGQYVLTKELGRGAMGVVYEALHVSLNRTVALKVLKSEFDTRDDAIERFRREGRSCAAIRHPNVVEIYDAGMAEGRPYYAMQLVPGTSLESWVPADGRPDAATVFRGFASIADALDVIHRAGIVHRDVKPANIMIRPDGTMVLADFGLARAVSGESLTTTGALVGTPLYMSPEQMTGVANELDGRADIYSLGAALYEVLTGCPVFKGESLTHMIRLVLQERPEDVRKRRPDLSRDAGVVVMKSLEKRKEDRYATAGEFAADLRALADGGNVAARPVARLVVASRALRKGWTVAAAVLVAAVVGAAVFASSAARAPGVIEVASFPAADAFLNGVAVGRTRLEQELPPGEHELVLKQPGFTDRAERITVTPGGRVSVERVLIASEGANRDALAQLASSLGVAIAEPGAAATTRGAASDGRSIRLLASGRIGASALLRLPVEVTESFDPDGEIRFEVGGALVSAVEFDPTATVTFVDVPDAVRDAASRAGELVWGYYPRSGAPTRARIEIAGAASDTKVASLDARLTGQPPRVAAAIRGRLLLAEKRFAEAAEVARAALEVDPDDEQSIATLHEALAAMSESDGSDR